MPETFTASGFEASPVGLNKPASASSSRATANSTCLSATLVTVKPSALVGKVSGAEQAWADARAAARASNIQVSELDRPDQHRALAEMFAIVWATQAGSPMPSEMMRALSFTGGYVAAAYHDGTPVGGVVGFPTYDTPVAGSAHLHSHVTGVVPALRSRRVGFALKLHQRAWALERGIDRITWTFDPLVSRNAYFNLVKLGASATAYLIDFYGDMIDSVNAGQGSDRLLVEWNLRSPGVAHAIAQALEGGQPERDDAAAATGYEAVLRVSDGDLPAAGPGEGSGPRACAVPGDIEQLRRNTPQAALAWRQATRSALGGSMASGYRITGFARSGWYLLRPAGQLGG